MARAKKTAAAGPLSEAALMVLLKERFKAPEYAFMPHVRNGTGWSRRTTRTADALAMSLWPSRGLDLHGFEIKSDRRDWLNEKANPEKAEEIAQFCDRWWLVIGAPDIVQPGELPATWGLLAADGEKLRVVQEAGKLEAKPLDRAQLAAILRRAAECVIPKAEIDEQLERARKDARERAEERAKQDAKYLRDDLASLKARVHAFELASGVSLGRSWESPQRIGEAVKFVLAGGLEREEARLRSLHGVAREVAEAVEQRLAALLAAETGTEG